MKYTITSLDVDKFVKMVASGEDRGVPTPKINIVPHYSGILGYIHMGMDGLSICNRLGKDIKMSGKLTDAVRCDLLKNKLKTNTMIRGVWVRDVGGEYRKPIQSNFMSLNLNGLKFIVLDLVDHNGEYRVPTNIDHSDGTVIKYQDIDLVKGTWFSVLIKDLHSEVMEKGFGGTMALVETGKGFSSLFLLKSKFTLTCNLSTSHLHFHSSKKLFLFKNNSEFSVDITDINGSLKKELAALEEIVKIDPNALITANITSSYAGYIGSSYIVREPKLISINL